MKNNPQVKLSKANRRQQQRKAAIARVKLEKTLAAELAKEFKRQGEATNAYLDAEGIHQWLYEDAQKQREKYFGKQSVANKVVHTRVPTWTENFTPPTEPWPPESDYQKALSDMTPPEDELKKKTKNWKKKVPKDNPKKILQKANMKAGVAGGNVAIVKLGIDVSFTLQNKKLIKALKDRGTMIADLVNENSLERFRKVLVKSYYYGGENVYQTKKDIQGLFAETYKNRAMTIARTETGGAQMAVEHETYKQNGVQKKKWISILDEKTRPSHVKCAKEGAIDFDKPFSNGLQHPCEAGAPAEEVINCRCDEVPVFEKSMLGKVAGRATVKGKTFLKREFWHGQDS